LLSGLENGCLGYQVNRKSGGRLSGQQDIRIIAILDAGYETTDDRRQKTDKGRILNIHRYAISLSNCQKLSDNPRIKTVEYRVA